MDTERILEDLGIGAVTGIRLMGVLGLTPSDFMDQSRFMRFKDVIDYFKTMPDHEYMINRITVGKAVDKLDHVWGYTQLAKQRDDVKANIKDVMSKMDTINDLGDETHHELVKGMNEKILNYQLEAKRVNEQIDAYEK